MKTYLLLSLLFMYVLFRSLHYSYLRNMFAQIWRPGFHFLLVSAFLFIRLQNLPVMLKNSCTSYSCIHKGYANILQSGPQPWCQKQLILIFHKDFYTPVPACFNQVSMLCLQVGLLFHTSYGFRHISTSCPSPGPSPVWIFLVTSKNVMPHDVILQFLHYL